jgi:tetratricopeptide (TPR) repeat protein
MCQFPLLVLSSLLVAVLWLVSPIATLAATVPAIEAPIQAQVAAPLPESQIQPQIAAPTEATALDLFNELNALGDKAFEATNAGDFKTAEGYWTQIIDRFPQNPAAWSNRGNARVSQNKLDAAIADYAEAMKLAPEAVDPYINRGTALEGLGQWEAAIADYDRALKIDPKDPLAYNNRGNAKTGLGQWEAAIADFQQASLLAPNYAFARANYALALYQTGQTDEAIRTMRNLVRKYPQFADMRAALTAALWVQGKTGEAESQWVSAVGLDSRYKDLNWVRDIRRWSPAMVAALEKFLSLQS